MEEETALLITACIRHKVEVENELYQTLPNPKNAKVSEKIRQKGNDLYLVKSHSHELHEEILCLYNKSAAVAPNCSQELAYSYGNRSAFLLHIGKYKECIQDIQKALEVTKCRLQKIKLLCRKVECLKNLDCPTQKDVLQEVQSLVDEFDNDKNKKSLNEMVKKFEMLSVNKKVDVKNQKMSNKTVQLSVTDNVLQKVSIKYNDKYGRHLVANQKYNPGDIIFVEKLYLSVDLKYQYINCHHCLKICWTGVPCKHCSWVIFCSEDCSQKAWEEYHDVECSLGTFSSNILFDLPFVENPGSSAIKILVKAVKDAGSIDNLRIKLKDVDQSTDACHKGFYKNGKFNSNTIESFYSLTQMKYSASEEITIIPACILQILISLIKHPLMKITQVKRIEDLIKNEEVMFLGSLLLKLTGVYLNNSRPFVHFLCNEENTIAIPKHPKGSCIASLSSLINNSCCPNTSLCFTEDGKVISFALQSIKKDDQIFISYFNEFYFKTLKDRRNDLKTYNFECDCQACRESWPPVLLESYGGYLYGKSLSYRGAEAEFVQQCSGVLDTIEKDDYRETSLKILSSKVNLAFSTLKQTSVFACILLGALSKCITKIYNGLQPQFYGDCKFLDAHSRCIVAAYKHEKDCGHKK